MPALTHGRVKNGFNGKQYTNMRPNNPMQKRRVKSNSSNRKFASTSTTGRSFAAKRAIARRVAKQIPVKNDDGTNKRDANGNIIVTQYCNIPLLPSNKPIVRCVRRTTTTSAITTTISGVWVSASPVTIPLIFSKPVIVNWNGEFIETIQPDSSSFKLITYNFATSGNKRITILTEADDTISMAYGDSRTALSDDTRIFVQLLELDADVSNFELKSGSFKNTTNATRLNFGEKPKFAESIESLFENSTANIMNMNSWDTSSVKNMKNMAKNAINFNGDISNWDTSNVVDLTSAFEGAVSFNADVQNWDTSNVVTMDNFSKNATNFNSDISQWNVSSLDLTGTTIATVMNNMLSGTARGSDSSTINDMVNNIMSRNDRFSDMMGSMPPTGGSDSHSTPPTGGSGGGDTTPPVITINGDNPMSLMKDSTFNDLGATATDNVDGSVPVSSSGIVDTSTAGVYSITYTASDNAGNEANAVREVIVLDISGGGDSAGFQ